MISITLTNTQKDQIIQLIKREIPCASGDELVALCEIIGAIPFYVFPTPAPVRLTSAQWHKIHCAIEDEPWDESLAAIDDLITETSEAFADKENAV